MSNKQPALLEVERNPSPEQEARDAREALVCQTVIGGCPVLLQHGGEVPPPRAAMLHRDWCGDGPTWVLSCEMTCRSRETALRWVVDGIAPGERGR